MRDTIIISDLIRNPHGKAAKRVAKVRRFDIENWLAWCGLRAKPPSNPGFIRLPVSAASSGRRLEQEAVVAEMFAQLLDPLPNERRSLGRSGNIDGLPVPAELKGRLACVRRHVPEYPLHGREVPVRRK